MRFLRWFNPEIAIGILLASVFWAAVLGWQAAYAPPEVEKQECYEAAKKRGQKTEECKTLWERTTTDPVALFTLVLAFSTIGLWVATAGLYFAGERQLSHLKESGERQSADMSASIKVAEDAANAAKEANKLSQAQLIAAHRPWIAIEDVVLEPVFAKELEHIPIPFKLVMRNLGGSPAFNLWVSVAFYPMMWWETPRDAQKGYCERIRRLYANSPNFGMTEPVSVVFPGKEHIYRSGTVVEEVELQSAYRHDGWRMNSYLIGCATYRSSLVGTPHQTWFIREFYQNEVPWVTWGPFHDGRQISGLTLRPYLVGDHAD